jgi:hypothetical protein
MSEKEKDDLLLIGDEYNKDNSKKECLLNEEKKPSMAREKDDLAKFYTQLGRNGGMVYRIGVYLVKDKEDSLKRKERKELIAVESLTGYTMEDIQVLEIDARSKPGYVHINGTSGFDIPLANLEGNSSKYFYDRNEAIKEWKRLSEIELSLAREIAKTSDAAVSYIKRVLDKEQY